MDLFCPPGMVYSQEKELCAESPVQEEDCRADLDTWNNKLLNMLRDEKKDEKRQMLKEVGNTQGKTARPVFDFRAQKDQLEGNRRKERLEEKKSNSYNNLFGKLI